MTVTIRELVLKPDYSEEDILHQAAKRLKCKKSTLILVKILRRSLDARAIRNNPCYIINATFDLKRPINLKNIKKVDEAKQQEKLQIPTALLDNRPIVIGAGPAGLFAALTLAKAGTRPIIYEQGKTVEERQKDVGEFWGKGILNTKSNVLFGEGGAGTFSDGKLTSRSKDRPRKNYVLNTLIECGAHPSIAYDSQAHIGSDKLAEVIPNLRKHIINLGGEFKFDSQLDDITITNNKLSSISINNTNTECYSCILATGHSARQVYNLLAKKNVALESKDFAVGVRVEIPQDIVNRSQLGKFANIKSLGSASFSLTNKGQCHTFCMCPGGRVIACADTAEELCTNGMSLSQRSGSLANAAFLISIPALNNATDGLDYLAKIEKAAFIAGGSDYSLPATTLSAFPHAPTNDLPFHSCQRIKSANFTELFSQEICNRLKTNISQMLKKIAGVEEAVIYGAETRSTSVLKISRGKDMQSINIAGLYPAGEGAGYAGGIISSAIDGVKAAQALLANTTTDTIS